MIKRTLATLALLTIAWPTQAAVWNFDPAHTSIGFSVRHMVISNVEGTFRDYTGQVNFDGKNLGKGSVDITIQMASINTGIEMRDNHLRSADFFDVQKYPTMTFKSKKIIKKSEGNFVMIGDLTIKGITHEVRIDCQFNGIITDPQGDTRAGFSGTTKINRQDYNVAWNNKLQDGSLIVGNDVTINLQIELVEAK